VPEPIHKGKAATQERILVAATELFIARGYEKTTMQDIADAASVSRATVFWHFSEKASLFREAFSRLLAPFRQSLERDWSGLAPHKRLEEQLAEADRFTREHLDEIGAFLHWAFEAPQFRESVLTTLLDLNQRFGGLLAQTLAELGPEGRDPKLLATGLLLAFDSRVLLTLADGSPRAADERSAAIDELVGLLAPQTRDES